MTPPALKKGRTLRERQALIICAVIVAITTLLPLWALMMATVFALSGMWWPCIVMVFLAVLFAMLTRIAFKAYRKIEARGFREPPV